MPADSTQPLPPRSVFMAAVAARTYGVLHIVTGLIVLTMIGGMGAYESGRQSGRALIVVIVAFVVGSGLMRLRPWAWWVSVMLGTIVGLGDLFAIPLPLPGQPFSRTLVTVTFSLEAVTLFFLVGTLLRRVSREPFGVVWKASPGPAA